MIYGDTAVSATNAASFVFFWNWEYAQVDMQIIAFVSPSSICVDILKRCNSSCSEGERFHLTWTDSIL